MNTSDSDLPTNPRSGAVPAASGIAQTASERTSFFAGAMSSFEYESSANWWDDDAPDDMVDGLPDDSVTEYVKSSGADRDQSSAASGRQTPLPSDTSVQNVFEQLSRVAEAVNEDNSVTAQASGVGGKSTPPPHEPKRAQ